MGMSESPRGGDGSPETQNFKLPDPASVGRSMVDIAERSQRIVGHGKQDEVGRLDHLVRREDRDPGQQPLGTPQRLGRDAARGHHAGRRGRHRHACW